MCNRRFRASHLVASATLLSALITCANSAHAQAAPSPSDEPAAPASAPATPAEPVAPAPESPAPQAEAKPAPAPVEEPVKPAETKPKPPPYSLPWQLRPVAPANVVRLDTAFGFYENPTTGKSGAAQATSLLGSYKVIPDLAVIARVGLVHNSPPDA